MYLKRNNNNAWIVNKHINDVNLLVVYAKLLKNNNNIDDKKVTEFTEFLKQKGLYNAIRNTKDVCAEVTVKKKRFSYKILFGKIISGHAAIGYIKK